MSATPKTIKPPTLGVGAWVRKVGFNGGLRIVEIQGGWATVRNVQSGVVSRCRLAKLRRLNAEAIASFLEQGMQ